MSVCTLISGLLWVIHSSPVVKQFITRVVLFDNPNPLWNMQLMKVEEQSDACREEKWNWVGQSWEKVSKSSCFWKSWKWVWDQGKINMTWYKDSDHYAWHFSRHSEKHREETHPLRASLLLMKRKWAGSQTKPATWHASTQDWPSWDTSSLSELRGGQVTGAVTLDAQPTAVELGRGTNRGPLILLPPVDPGLERFAGM